MNLPSDSLPLDGPLLAYLGDDFTGSTDAMEAFTAAGVSTVLFLNTPTPEWLKRFSDFRCIGLASTARSQSPEWMDQHLPQLFESLKAFGAPLLQYKVCSTFDSSPSIGSIGRAIDIGTKIMDGTWSPMVVGVPHLKRYQAFGNLFAAASDTVYRLDRNPSMSRHPVTPMLEADLRLHLALQTSRNIELVNLIQLKTFKSAPSKHKAVVLFDVLDDESLASIGRAIWEGRGDGVFSASSSGLQYALSAYWRKQGYLPSQPSLPKLTPVKLIAAICGSCSPVTAQQIAWAQANGFVSERLVIARILDESQREREIERILSFATQAIAREQSPMVYSATGPDDPAVTSFERTAATSGKSRNQAAREVGVALAEISKRLLLGVPDLKRIAIAGGDSSGVIASALEIAALSVKAALVPGAPLCSAWSDNQRFDGLEIVLKGGQMGTEDFFGRVLGIES